MRIFFPGLLLLVALIVFVIAGWLLFLALPNLYNEVVDSINVTGGVGLPIFQKDILITGSLLLNLLLSSWAAAWAWKEIRREKMERVES